jgi:hypothetical protein
MTWPSSSPFYGWITKHHLSTSSSAYKEPWLSWAHDTLCPIAIYTAVCQYNGTIYVVGALRDHYDKNAMSLVSYDIAHDGAVGATDTTDSAIVTPAATSTTSGKKRTEWKILTKIPGALRRGSQLVGIQGFLYLMGGEEWFIDQFERPNDYEGLPSGPRGPMTDMVCYDINNNQWKSRSSMMHARQNFHSTVVHHQRHRNGNGNGNGGASIIVSSSLTSQFSSSDIIVERYDVRTNRWYIHDSLPADGSLHSLITVNALNEDGPRVMAISRRTLLTENTLHLPPSSIGWSLHVKYLKNVDIDHDVNSNSSSSSNNVGGSISIKQMG